ncbi:carboxymuconolactone decarboxylase family protein [Ruegeria sp.]|uniref:carboxymuconolactone decarboxylase family protein n=1 Tax=Ruegeria sp. TaxID=1879320 RepID=UPI003B5AFDAE
MKRLFPSLSKDATLGTVLSSFPDKLAPWCEYVSLVMRGDSDLSFSERELIAAYVSGLNACSYCHGAHTTFAHAFGIDPKLIEALMTDLDSAPVEQKLKPILAYVSKLTLTPSRMAEQDARDVYAAGWSEEALFDAIQVCGAFNLVNRIVEGTGISRVQGDPTEIDENRLRKLRSESFYTDFGREKGLDV